LLPALWLAVLLVAALLTRRPARRQRLLVATLVLFLLGTNGALVNEALLAWELPPARTTAADRTAWSGRPAHRHHAGA